MRKYCFLLILLALDAMLTSCKTSQVVELQSSKPIQDFNHSLEHSPNVFLITYDAEVTKDALLKAIKEQGCDIVYDYHSFNGMALKKPREKSLEETMQYFRTVKGVLTVDYDRIIRLTDPVKPRLEVK